MMIAMMIPHMHSVSCRESISSFRTTINSFPVACLSRDRLDIRVDHLHADCRGVSQVQTRSCHSYVVLQVTNASPSNSRLFDIIREG